MDDLEEPKRIRRAPEPQNQYEWCERFGKITGLGTGRFLKMTKGWTQEGKYHWFFEIQSQCKYEKDPAKQKIVINDWFKKYRESLNPLQENNLK